MTWPSLPCVMTSVPASISTPLITAASSSSSVAGRSAKAWRPATRRGSMNGIVTETGFGRSEQHGGRGASTDEIRDESAGGRSPVEGCERPLERAALDAADDEDQARAAVVVGPRIQVERRVDD